MIVTSLTVSSWMLNELRSTSGFPPTVIFSMWIPVIMSGLNGGLAPATVNSFYM